MKHTSASDTNYIKSFQRHKKKKFAWQKITNWWKKICIFTQIQISVLSTSFTTQIVWNLQKHKVKVAKGSNLGIPAKLN